MYRTASLLSHLEEGGGIGLRPNPFCSVCERSGPAAVC